MDLKTPTFPALSQISNVGVGIYFVLKIKSASKATEITERISSAGWDHYTNPTKQPNDADGVRLGQFRKIWIERISFSICSMVNGENSEC